MKTLPMKEDIGFRSLLTLARVGLALFTVAAEGPWRRIDYPDFVRQMPQMKGVMLGASGEKEFKDLHAMGATLVRYQMNADFIWKKKQLASEPEAFATFNKWLDKKLDHLEEMLPWARRCGIKICVDFHTVLGGQTAEQHASNMMFVEKKYEDLLVSTWEKIATRFKGNQDAIYGYDLVNEPMDRENKLTTTTWRAVMCRTVEAVRKIDPITPIVVEPNCHASPRGFDVKNIYGLKGFEPLPYDNLIYSVHVYQPMDYTHQGLFKKKADYNPRPYPGKGRLRDPNRNRYAGDLGDKDESKDVWDKDFVRQEIQSVRDFQLATGARIFVGEFSAAAYAPGAEVYLKDLCELFEEYGWDWTYHAFREAPCWSFEYEGESFHELKPAKGKTPRAKVIESFFGSGGKAGRTAVNSSREVQAALGPYVERGEIAGVISVLSDGNYNETWDVFGYADVENRVPMRPNTMFAIFSMSKTVLGAAMMCAIDDGVISLDDSVSRFFPEYANLKLPDGRPSWREVTIRDLTTHVDGIRSERSFFDNRMTLREAAHWYAQGGLSEEPGATFKYGTARFAVAAACLEVATGKRYEDYLDERIFKPIGMRDTTFNPDEEQVSRMVKPYTTKGGPFQPANDMCCRALRFPKGFHMEPGAGTGLYSTAADMIRFSQMLAHHGEYRGRTIISRKTFDSVFARLQVPAHIEQPYTCGAWLYGDWFGHEGAMRTDQRANLKTGDCRVFFIQTENAAGKAFFDAKASWHRACDAYQKAKIPFSEELVKTHENDVDRTKFYQKAASGNDAASGR